MGIQSIVKSWRQKITQNPTGWGALLLFALGLIVLISIMRSMPYALA